MSLPNIFMTREEADYVTELVEDFGDASTRQVLDLLREFADAVDGVASKCPSADVRAALRTVRGHIMTILSSVSKLVKVGMLKFLFRPLSEEEISRIKKKICDSKAWTDDPYVREIVNVLVEAQESPGAQHVSELRQRFGGIELMYVIVLDSDLVWRIFASCEVPTKVATPSVTQSNVLMVVENGLLFPGAGLALLEAYRYLVVEEMERAVGYWSVPHCLARQVAEAGISPDASSLLTVAGAVTEMFRSGRDIAASALATYRRVRNVPSTLIDSELAVRLALYVNAQYSRLKRLNIDLYKLIFGTVHPLSMVPVPEVQTSTLRRWIDAVTVISLLVNLERRPLQLE